VFAVVGAVGSAFTIRGLITLPIGTEPWLAAALGLLIILAGLVFIELGWLWIQREITIADGRMVVRRWIDAVRGRPGREIPLGPGVRTSITLENVRSLRIERNDVTEAVLTLGYWERSSVRDLIDGLRANGVPFVQYWTGAYPPDLASMSEPITQSTDRDPGFREPMAHERRLLSALVSQRFPGSAELTRQLEFAEVRPIVDNPSLDILISDGPSADVDRRIPVEAAVEDSDGVTVHILLHVVDNFMNELEVYREDLGSLKSPIDVTRLRFIVL
jgi:hypothetical protein